MKSIILKARFVWIGIANIPKLNLGDIVNYKGSKWILTQGVSSPYWNMKNINTHEYLKDIHSNDFKKDVSYGNIRNAIRGTYRFYMGYWYDIFMRIIPIGKCLLVTYGNYQKYRING